MYVERNVVYDVTHLRLDIIPGGIWVPEPHTNAEFWCKGQFHSIHGVFRHSKCQRLSLFDEPYTNLMCGSCFLILLEHNFRMRVRREEFTLKKRGTRSTDFDKHLGYLQASKLAKFSLDVRKTLRDVISTHMVQKSKVVMLKMSRPSLKAISMEILQHKDVFAFCSNILHAHQTNASKGMPAL